MPTTRIIDTTTGDVILRHLETAAHARRELARELGRWLIWEREEAEWVARDGETEYRVDVDSTVQECSTPNPSTTPQKSSRAS